VRCLLFDIEGTVTSLAFVHEELFPYARKALPGFLRVNSGRPEVARIVERLAREGECDPADLDRIATMLVQWVDEDRKQTELKELQGIIWEEGYRTGAYRGHLYPDVLPFWKRAREHGLVLGIYSSGSVQAQRLLLAHSVEGDLSALIDRHYDTHIGPKTELESYRRIAADLAVAPVEVRFFSDSVAELDAARGAGLATCRLVRPGVPPAFHIHPEVSSFAGSGSELLA
jgi:enolase-phosphatase E1